MSDGGARAAAPGKKVRVLHFLPWLSGGGVEVGLRELIRGLPVSRYEHHVACIVAKGPRLKEFESMGLPITILGGQSNIRNIGALARLTRLARSWRAHVLHASVFEGQVLGTIAGRLAGVPVVVTEEATFPSPPGDRSRTTRLLLKQLLLRNDVAVAIAPSVRRYLVNQNGLPAELVRVVRYGVAPPARPVDDVLLAERHALGIPEGSLVVGTVCRLHDRHKRVSDLIRGVARLQSALPQLHLLVVGDGPDRQSLHEVARDLGIEGRVHFAGYRASPASCFFLMDVFALPSAFEGFGIVFIEAALCGLPCIGTAVGGIVDAIDDRVTGLLVPPGDLDSLTGAIAELAADAGLRQRMGRAGAWRAQRLHSPEEYARAFDALFQEALARRGVRVG